MLPQRIDEIAAAGVSTLTVTVNAVDPVIQAQITPEIAWQAPGLDGVAAAERLIANQLERHRPRCSARHDHQDQHRADPHA
ncbi:MAG: hypothetical protein MZV49_08195 [Rhodopseudomonas palustris]|nr:hypothetical protein [Rhodopseudomonas palustris]